MITKMLNEESYLKEKALDLRRKIIQTTLISGEAGHITSSFSCLDILTALYFGDVLRYDSSNPDMPDRDRFVLSKGHGALAIYNVLCEAGFFDRDQLNTYSTLGSKFGAHPSIKIPGIECATGSLGHGLSFAVGAALSARLKKSDHLIYVVTGDGEIQEGSIWEAAMSIAHYNLANLIWIIDYNRLQQEGRVDKIMQLEPLHEKLEAFGFHAVTIDGHDYTTLIDTLSIDRSNPPNKPLAVIANTIKGKGAPLFENKEMWHGKKPNADEYAEIIQQLGTSREELMGL
jgi:transketolase